MQKYSLASKSGHTLKRLAAGVSIGILGATGMGMTAYAAPALSNGSFETGVTPGSFVTLFAGNNTSIPGWTVTANLDYIGSYWVSSDGHRSLDLNGVMPGAISQTL